MTKSLPRFQRHAEYFGGDAGVAAAPAAVRRAEEFMWSKAEEVLTVEHIARAAGCSARALQLAFRRFRAKSPMEMLRGVRLELAHQAIMRLDASASVWDVATRYGFSNTGRFANQYLRAFGEYPSMTLRHRGWPRDQGSHEAQIRPTVAER
jgi:transcriptional regulator GlxA family with amidase domain